MIELMVFIENQRDSFCCGVDQKIDDLRAVMSAFQDLRAIFQSMGVVER